MRISRFTMVELVVIVTFSAIMGLLLVPLVCYGNAVNGNMLCKDNLKKIIDANLSFSKDRQGWGIGNYVGKFGTDVQTDWCALLADDKYLPDLKKKRAGEPLEGSVMKCSEETIKLSPGTLATNYGINSSIRWGAVDKNIWECKDDFVKLESIKKPADIVWYGDSLPNYYAITAIEAEGPAFRHNNETNMGFFDGHIEPLNRSAIPFGTRYDTKINAFPWFY